MSTTIQAQETSLRSPIYRKFEQATFSEVPNAVLPAVISTEDASNARQGGLLDLSVIARTGFRGQNAQEHLSAQNLPIPEKPNQAELSDNGELVLRLSNNEFWVLGSITEDQGKRVIELADSPLPEARCYPLYCQNSHAWFVMSGPHLAQIMAKVCGVDLRTEMFPVGAIAQTSIARVNAVVVHHTVNGLSTFSILSDSASAQYLWESLLDAMDEFQGKAIGIEGLLSND